LDLVKGILAKATPSLQFKPRPEGRGNRWSWQ